MSIGVAAVSTGQIGGGGGQHQKQQSINAFSQRNENKNEVLGLYSQQRESQRYVKKMHCQLAILTSTMSKGMCKMQTNLNRLSQMPAQMLRGNVSTVASSVTNANNNPNSNIENFAVGTKNNNHASNDDKQPWL
jgi:hypothetical protein